MAITLDGTTGITATAFDGALDATDLTGDVAAARITTALNAAGSAPIYACRAWVNFNGTGAVAIRGSGNVSSITDLGTGFYQVNFATALLNNQYCVSGSNSFDDLLSDVGFLGVTETLANSTTNCQISTRSVNGTLYDAQNVYVAVFG